jgi:hypothetical protein
MPDSEMLPKICFEVRESSEVNDQTVRGSFLVANYGNYCISLSLGVRDLLLQKSRTGIDVD